MYTQKKVHMKMNLEGSCLQVRLQLPPVTTLLDLDIGISASGLRQINVCDLNHTDYSIRGSSREELPMPEVRGSGREEQPHVQSQEGWW